MADAFDPSIEVPSSPPLPVAPRNERKRTRPAFLIDENTPSDPAVFSSDPADPSAEHYFAPRKKKVYRGTWWQNGEEKGEGSGSGRKGFERNLDSGIWMESESSNVGSDDLVPDEEVNARVNERRVVIPRKVQEPEPRSVVKARKRIICFAEQGDYTDPSDEPDPDLREWLEERASFRVGWDWMNLDDLALPCITDDMIAPLRSIVRQPPDAHWFNADEYYDWIPQYNFSLGRNALQSVPSSLFALPGVDDLDLSYNNLTAVPTRIPTPNSLRSLSLQGNRLRWLPGALLECLWTSKEPWRGLNVSSNPLYQPFSFVGLSGLLFKEEAMRDNNFLPSSLANMRERMHFYANAGESEDDTVQPETRVLHQRWLMRLCEHYLRLPELIWWRYKPTHSFPKEDVNEIMEKWQHLSPPTNPTFEQVLRHMEHEMDKVLPRHTFLMAATQVTYLDICGRPVVKGMSRPSTLPMDQSIVPARLIALPPTPQLPLSMAYLQEEGKLETQSRVHSLFSLSLLAAAAVPELQHLPSLLPEDAPDAVHRGLDAAITARTEGGWNCNTCGRSYIIPRAEWVEYRFLPALFDETREKKSSMRTFPTITELFIPFLKTACSWGCVPDFDYESD